MLPKNLLINLLYRYKLVKQAALNDYIKEARLKQLQYQDQIQKLMDLYRADSLVKKASLLNDLYEQALLTKLASTYDKLKHIQKQKAGIRQGNLVEYNRLLGEAGPALERALAKGLITEDELRKFIHTGIADPDFVQRVAREHKGMTAGILEDALRTKNLIQRDRIASVLTAAPTTHVVTPSIGGGFSVNTLNTPQVKPEPSTLAALEPTTPQATQEGSRLSRLKQLFSTIGSKIKSNRQGLIGGGIGLLTGLGAGLLTGRSSAYEKGKAEAIRNLNEEDIRKALLALGGSKK
jgi:hypothetical protein